MDRRDVQAMMEDMVDEVDPEELIYRIYLFQKLEAAEEDVKQGRLVTHEEMDRRIEQWRS